MRIIITDNEIEVSSNDFVVCDDVLSCRGCFSCWTKNNYKCIMHDYIQDIGNKFLECDEIIIITKCINGSYASKVKRVLERSIGFVKPFFELRDNEIHHMMRSNRKIPCTILVYDVNESDKATFEKLVKANNLNLPTWQMKIVYVNNFEEAKNEVIHKC